MHCYLLAIDQKQFLMYDPPIFSCTSTRVGATQSRLEIYAEATKFYQRLKKSEIKAACHQKGLVLENPTYGKLW